MRWTHRPDGSNWGDFGPDDQLGRLNLITPEKVRQGVAEVHDGRSFCLSLPLDYPGGAGLNPRRHPPVLRPTMRGQSANFNVAVPDAPDVICDDLALLHLQYSTQWDSFAHVGQRFDADGDGIAEHVFYNGWRGGEDVVGPTSVADAGPGVTSTSAAKRLGIENFAVHGIQGRAVLVDLLAHFGPARRLITGADLALVLAADGVSVEAGDMLCLHTGFAQALLDAAKNPSDDLLHNQYAVLDGRCPDLQGFLRDSGVSALIADNYAVEAYPARPCDTAGHDCSILPLHELCLFKLGIPLGELWHLTPLAQYLRGQNRSRFFLTAPPLRLPGAVGSPVTPIATV
ncbi:MAG TPA: cyclase [Rhodobacteraceae bacterium]|jgi:kynurenine formamidase|nr:cyclase [Paracoccaceae bacterium]